MPRAFTEQEQTVVRRRLMDEAARIFAVQGIRNTSIDQIVQACGIAKGSFYRFFPSKEDLAFAVLSEIEAGEQARILEAVEGAGSLREALRFVLDASFTTIDRHPVIARINDPQEMWWLLMRGSDEHKQAMESYDLVFASRVIATCVAKGWETSFAAEELTLAGRYLMGLSLLAANNSGKSNGLVPPDLDRLYGPKVRAMILDGLIDRLLNDPHA